MNVVLYLFVIIKNILKIKYVIYETYNIIFNILWLVKFNLSFNVFSIH